MFVAPYQGLPRSPSKVIDDRDLATADRDQSRSPAPPSD